MPPRVGWPTPWARAGSLRPVAICGGCSWSLASPSGPARCRRSRMRWMRWARPQECASSDGRSSAAPAVREHHRRHRCHVGRPAGLLWNASGHGSSPARRSGCHWRRGRRNRRRRLGSNRAGEPRPGCRGRDLLGRWQPPRRRLQGRLPGGQPAPRHGAGHHRYHWCRRSGNCRSGST